MINIVKNSISRDEIQTLTNERFGDMVKAVVDVARGAMAVGGEMHADEEAALLADGSRQTDLWGINLYPAQTGDAFIEFDSMINLRPSQNNRSRGANFAMKPYTPYSVYGNGWLIISVATPSCSSSTCRVEVSRLSLANTYWLAYGSGIEINRLSTTMPFSRSSSFHRSTKRMKQIFFPLVERRISALIGACGFR